MLKYLRQQNSNEEKGATMIEAAMVLPFVLFFLFVSIDLFIFAYQAVGVQFLSSNVMRDVTTSDRASVGQAYGVAYEKATDFLLRLNHRDARLCLCQLTDTMRLPNQCRNSTAFCARLGSVPQTATIPPGESFVMVIRYPVPQLFSLLLKQDFNVEAVAIGRVEPRGVS